MVDVVIPPTLGAAIGFMPSDPIPDSHKISARLRIPAATVISLGRNRWTARRTQSLDGGVGPYRRICSGGTVTRSLAEPVFPDDPVLDMISGVKDNTQRLLTSGANLT